MASAATAAVASSSAVAVERRNLVTYLGNRINVTLDDDSILTGRLVSLSASGNLILTDVERQRVLKRRRSRDGVHATTRECYAAVLFVRGGCVVSIGYNSGLTTDKSVVDHIDGTEASSSRAVQIANAAPSAQRRNRM
jgi:small nuclear ribonucleoprotein (snRNP)-like protein